MTADPADPAAVAYPDDHPDQPDQYVCTRAWEALAAAHARVSGQLSGALMRVCGLSIHDFEVLLRLEGVAPPGRRLGELEQPIRLSQSALSRLVARLEHQGLLCRHGDPDDRRGVLLTITPAGRELLRRAVPVHARCVSQTLTCRLSPAERALLADVLTRIADG